MQENARDYVVAVIDDDESIRSATINLIRLSGHEVHGFASAEAFLESAALHQTRCIVSDIRMPGMGGLELQASLAASGLGIPLIFVTAFPEDRTRDRALAAGAFAFMSKPFDGEILLRTIERALAAPG